MSQTMNNTNSPMHQMISSTNPNQMLPMSSSINQNLSANMNQLGGMVAPGPNIPGPNMVSMVNASLNTSQSGTVGSNSGAVSNPSSQSVQPQIEANLSRLKNLLALLKKSTYEIMESAALHVHHNSSVDNGISVG